jgi:hypothetical protein
MALTVWRGAEVMDRAGGGRALSVAQPGVSEDRQTFSEGCVGGGFAAAPVDAVCFLAAGRGHLIAAEREQFTIGP